jgi:biopolymer transport protein ExbD
MIDVMFFLLATFMLASLSLQNLHSLAVNLPRGQAPPLQVPNPVTLTVTRDGAVLLNETGVTLDTLPSVLRAKVGGREATVRDTSVVIAADDAAPSGIVVQAMLKAREAGAERFLFAVSRK